MKHLKTLLLIGCLVCLGASKMAPKAKADELDQKTFLNFEKPVQLPGIVLPAGTYIFKIVKLATDRDVVQVLSTDETKIYATIMTIPALRENATEDTSLIFEERSAGVPQALKEWFFPDRLYGHEFVYPKGELSELAKSEPAETIQPAEATEPTEQPMQSEDSDYLKLLQQKQTEPAEVAEANESGSLPPSETESNQMETPEQEQAPAQVAMANELPRTASHLPLVFVSGILLVMISFGLRFKPSK